MDSNPVIIAGNFSCGYSSQSIAVILGITMMNHNNLADNTNVSNNLNNNNVNEMDVIISKNNHVHAWTVPEVPAQAQVANNRHGRGHETTAITPVLIRNQHWDYQIFADKPFR